MEKTLKSLTLSCFSARYRRNNRLIRKFEAWKETGLLPPMPHWGKQLVIREYIEKLSPSVFVETGTYKGDMVYAMQPHFEEIYSI